jgi:hypothetical protein
MALMKDYYSYKALSNSGIKRILRSPAHFKHWLSAERKMSKSLILGELVHYFLLRPDLVADEVAVFEKGKTLDSKLGNKFILNNPDKFCCTRDQYEYAEHVSKTILQDRRVSRLIGLPNAKREHPIIQTINGVPGKALYDLLSPEIILDVKTHSDEGGYFNNAESFDANFFKYGYDIQAAWYQRMAEIWDGMRRDVLFLVVEMEEPFAYTIRQVEQDDMDSAWTDCERAIEIYKECLATDVWPGYPFEIRTIKKPKWRKMQQMA